MSRCVGCSAVMTGAELGRKQPDGSLETLCTRCLIAAGVLHGDDYDYLFNEVNDEYETEEEEWIGS